MFQCKNCINKTPSKQRGNVRCNLSTSEKENTMLVLMGSRFCCPYYLDIKSTENNEK